MSIYIDDAPVNLAANTLEEALLAAKRFVEPSGRILVEVALDGERIVGDELTRRQAESLAGRTLRLATADGQELLVQTLGEVRRQLDEAARMQGEAADCLQRDQPRDALSRIADAIVIWQHTGQVVSTCAAMMKLPLGSLAAGGQTFERIASDLAAMLTTLRDLLVARDAVGLADTLAYEWPATTQRWQELIDQLIAKARRQVSCS
jgi:hypothetical protein